MQVPLHIHKLFTVFFEENNNLKYFHWSSKYKPLPHRGYGYDFYNIDEVDDAGISLQPLLK